MSETPSMSDIIDEIFALMAQQYETHILETEEAARQENKRNPQRFKWRVGDTIQVAIPARYRPIE
jgi:hypothetical protein